MKIKDLDRNEVYDLTEIKKDAVKFDLLKEWLRENDNWNSDNLLGLDDTLDLFYSMEFRGWYHDGELKPTKCALTLFDLDITDYQVDCSELSSEQIGELCDIFKLTGRKLIITIDALDISNKYKYFRTYYNDFGIFEINLNKIIITYEKFIELFGGKPIEQAVEQKPSQYQIGIDTFTRAEANMTKEEILACVRFNIDKYTWRKKGQDKEDFEKIKAYVDWGLKNL